MTPLAIAESFTYYLPQFHTIPENDEWWGKGFTEWTKIREAKKVHKEQIIQTPGELGWYDLSDVAVIGRQYELARKHGIGAFAFWHYWFGDNDLLLQRPAERLLASDEDARFCMAWANHDWLKRSTGQILRKQTYKLEAATHFEYLEPFFHDARYVKIDGRPVMFLFSPGQHPYLEAFVTDMHRRAEMSGFNGMYFIFDHTGPRDSHVAFCDRYLNSTSALKFANPLSRLLEKATRKRRAAKGLPQISDYKDCVKHLRRTDYSDPRAIPVGFPGWDTSIRHGTRGQLLLHNKPSEYGTLLDSIHESLKARAPEDRLVVFKSWNEWAEGNLLEPSDQWGRAFLEETAKRFVISKQ